MTEAVTDRYATELAALVYEDLARAEHPVPLAALSRARRRLEAARQQLPAGDPRGAWPEWSTPSLFLAGPPLPLFDAGQGVERVAPMPEEGAGRGDGGAQGRRVRGASGGATATAGRIA
ncbi:hypothetical protein [Streptomyces sp. DT2A-34]|uniref:hypothetical protein n=1 Tax=Streptomyces sp. DT2A-34 TaxID=3051182 RepID=UPI0034642C1E